MEARKILKIGNSLYVNIPPSVVEKFRVKRGDVVWIGYHPGNGAIISKGRNLGRVAAGVACIDDIKVAADEAFAEVRRKVKSLERGAVNTILTTLMGEGVKRTLVDLQDKKLELSKKRKKYGCSICALCFLLTNKGLLKAFPAILEKRTGRLSEANP